MIKRIIIAALATAFMLTSAACSSLLSTTQTYLKALETTNKADSYQSRTEISLNLDLSKAPENIRKDFEKYKETTFNIDQSIDNKNEKGQVDSLVSSGDFMLNSRIYVKGNQVFMKSIMTGDKYMLLTPEMDNQEIEKMKKANEGYAKLFDDAAAIWKGSIENEILAKMGDTIVYTPDGDIKVTQLSLELTDDKTKTILDKLSKAVSENEKLRESIIEGGLKNKPADVDDKDIEKAVTDFLKNLPSKMEEYKDRFALNKLKLTARIDKDSYIIDQTVEADIVLKLDDGEIGINLTSKTTRWNFNNDIKIDIPKISKEDIMDPEEMNKDSEFYKDIEKMFKK